MGLIESADHRIIEAATQAGGTGEVRDQVVFAVAEILPFVLVLTGIILFWRGKTKKQRERNQEIVLLGLAAVLIAVGTRWLITELIHRPRPFVTFRELHHLSLNVDAASFPSGHALYTFTFAGVIYFVGYRKLGAVLLLTAAIVSAGRVFAGAHYPTDVIVGAALGLGVARVVTWQTTWVKRQLR